MDTVLIIEDDKLSRMMLRELLEAEGFIIIEAANGKRGNDIIAHHHIDLVILDLQLPDGNGIDFIEEYRKETNVPVIILSGSHDKQARISGLTQGADDYVSKPFDPDDLKARVKANLRRYKQAQSNENFSSRREDFKYEDHDLTFGPWSLDRKKFQVFDQHSASANLTVHEFNLLDKLIQKAGHVMRREDLCEALRERNYVPAPRAIDVKITRIRKKLRDGGDNPQYIKTVRGIGYMFTENITIHR